jgi:hypothetical protein
MDTEDQIPPSVPLQKGGIPPLGYLFPTAQAGLRGDLSARSRFGEGRGEIF